MLWLLAGHLLALRWGLLFSISVLAGVVFAPILHHGTLNYADVFGPLIGGIFAFGISRGYLQLLKDASPAVIIEAIGQAASGNLFLAPDLATRVIRGMSNPLPKLTAREIDVLKLLATGSANKQIARSLFVTEATVKSHLNSIFTKLDVDSRSRAIHVAQETGLI